jgi:hypothetical protein
MFLPFCLLRLFVYFELSLELICCASSSNFLLLIRAESSVTAAEVGAAVGTGSRAAVATRGGGRLAVLGSD